MYIIQKAIPPSRLRKQDGGNYFCIVMLFILSEKQFLCYPCAPLYSVAQRISISSYLFAHTQYHK